MKSYSGYTCDTAKSLLLDAGAFFKNFAVGVDTFDTALAQGKCLGATQGGGTFVATPTVRAIEIDGTKTTPKGLTRIDSWDISLQVNVIEITSSTLKNALGNGVVDTSNYKYDIVTAKSLIDLDDYFDNITWVGTLSGSNEPVIIQIYNAINTEGINLTVADKAEAVISMTFKAHQSCVSDINIQPFAIYYPKAVAVPTIEEVDTSTTILKGTGLSGSTIYVSGGSIPPNTTAIVNVDGNWSVNIPAQLSNTVIYVKQANNGKYSNAITGQVKLVAPTINTTLDTDTKITGTGLSGATVQIYGGNIAPGTTTIVDSDGNWEITVTEQQVDTIIFAIQYVNGVESLETYIEVEGD